MVGNITFSSSLDTKHGASATRSLWLACCKSLRALHFLWLLERKQGYNQYQACLLQTNRCKWYLAQISIPDYLLQQAGPILSLVLYADFLFLGVKLFCGLELKLLEVVSTSKQACTEGSNICKLISSLGKLPPSNPWTFIPNKLSFSKVNTFAH